MGCPDSTIPEQLLRKTHVNFLVSNQNTKQLYNDNLCLLPVLAVHFHGITNLETSTIFIDFPEKSSCEPKQFCGVSMANLPIVEDVEEKIDIDIGD